ncbi:MAG: hypothetical protein AAF567_01195 [Actinomycetota bacterium]
MALRQRPLHELAGVGYQLERASLALIRGDGLAASRILDAASADLIIQLEEMRASRSNLAAPDAADGDRS